MTILFFLLIFSALTVNAQQKLMHYWHFNTFVGVGAATNPATLPQQNADYSTLGSANIQYRLLPQVTSSILTYWDASTGDTTNSRLGTISGSSMRFRNPSDSMCVLIYSPSTNYKNPTFKYEAQKSSATNGASAHYYSYSVDSGLTWITTGLSTLSNTITNYSGGTPPWPTSAIQVSINDLAANNNSKLVFRITFGSVGSTGTSGNNRIDNFTVDGDTILSPTININGISNPFASLPLQYSASQSFTIDGFALSDTLHLTAPANFEISLTDIGTYSNSLFLLPDANNEIALTTIYVKFIPSSAGTFNGNITASSLGASSKLYFVEGTTLPVPTISVSGTPVPTFPNTPLSTFSNSYKIVVSTLNLSDSVYLFVNPPFYISKTINSLNAVNDFALAMNSTDSVYVFFKPSSYGSFNENLEIGSVGANDVFIPLSGISIPPPQITYQNLPLSTFNQVVVGQNSAIQTFLIDAQDLTGSLILTVNSPFLVSSDSITFATSLNLTPVSGSFTAQKVFVRCFPHFSGNYNDSIVIVSPDFANYSIILSATTFDPFVGLTLLYNQDFTNSATTSLPSGWSVSDTLLWGVVNTNTSIDYAFATAGNCMRFDNEGSELPKTAYAEMSGFIPTNGFKDITIIWGARRSTSFFNGLINGEAYILYSANGTTWDTIFYPAEPNNSSLWTYVNNTTPITLPSSADYNTGIKIRWVYRSEGLGSSGTYRFDDVRVFGTASTSISQNSNNFFQIYPNPATSIIQILTNEKIINLKICDILGRVVKIENNPSKELNISNLESGYYILSIENSKGEIQKTKFIKF